ncbi:MAG: general secretion pathway protein GspK [Myxococcales bacterium]|nr:general secretion pathway protein GspK [Myxococcales bacterium]
MSRTGQQEGVVLLLVLVILVATVGSVYAFTAATTLDVLSLRQRADRVRAELLARSGLAVAVRVLAEDGERKSQSALKGRETWMDDWRILSLDPILPEEDSELRIMISDSGSWIALNQLIQSPGKRRPDSAAFLTAVIQKIIDEMPGRDEEKFYEAELVAEGILDWIDVDKKTRRGEDEAAYYAEKGNSRSPRNFLIFSLQQLSDVPGMDPALMSEFEAYFGTLPWIWAGGPSDKTGVNPNTAPPHILSTIFYGAPTGKKRLIDGRDVFEIMRARDEGKIFCELESEDCTGFQAALGMAGQSVFPNLRFSSLIFRVRIDARVRDALVRTETMLHRRDLADYKFLSHRVL